MRPVVFSALIVLCGFFVVLRTLSSEVLPRALVREILEYPQVTKILKISPETVLQKGIFLNKEARAALSSINLLKTVEQDQQWFSRLQYASLGLGILLALSGLLLLVKFPWASHLLYTSCIGLCFVPALRLTTTSESFASPMQLFPTELWCLVALLGVEFFSRRESLAQQGEQSVA